MKLQKSDYTIAIEWIRRRKGRRSYLVMNETTLTVTKVFSCVCGPPLMEAKMASLAAIKGNLAEK